MSIRPLFAVGRWRVVGENRKAAIQALEPKFRGALRGAQKAAEEHLENQEDSYDWRGINTLNNKFLRRIIELMPGGSEDVWRNSMD